jgi:hypothetical protein
MHHLQAVAIGQGSAGPLVARHDLAIAFHRDTILLHFQLGDEFAQHERLSEFALFSID